MHESIQFGLVSGPTIGYGDLAPRSLPTFVSVVLAVAKAKPEAHTPLFAQSVLATVALLIPSAVAQADLRSRLLRHHDTGR